ncbi:MAG TPA: hypothetical protein VHJ78_01350 [Actinomycetota bacterium]|nr:hypothetical protein [Actinomycetota bacterium]
MQYVAFAVPLLPGKEDKDREAMLSCWTGERSKAHHAARARLGITRESVWAQDTPNGKIAVVYLEADDLAAAFRGLATSDDPFDSWFREHSLEVHGLDLTQEFPPPELVLDYQDSETGS